jgi:serralysin
VNTDPVVTLFNTGTDNTLDASGYKDDQRIDLHAGAFSDIGGHFNNVAIAFDTVIENAKGGGGDDKITASDVSSQLSGGKGADTLVGGAGRDVLKGGADADHLVGGAGNDRFIGGGGSDVFAFGKGDFGASTTKAGDLIRDFQSGHDQIDLSAVDANSSAKGNQDFVFLGGDQFDGKAGELRFDNSGHNTMIYGDVDGDGVADFAIKLVGEHALTAADFVL